MKRILLVVAILATIVASAQQKGEVTRTTDYSQDETIVLWDNNNAPHSNGLEGEAYESKPHRLVNTTKAILYAYKANKSKATGQAVVICPGGGYGRLAMEHEGRLMAQWLTENGIAAFLLEYRLPNGHKEVPLEDVVEAIRTVRKNAEKFNIDPAKVGVMGFSAGGHLAASVSNIPPVEDRPNFSILYYPVLLANHYASSSNTYHNLLGKNHSASEADEFSMEKLVSKNTPPTILLLSDNDNVVPAAGAAIYYSQLRYHGVKAAMYIFPMGNHGWGNKSKFSYQKEWQHLLLRWLNELK